MDILIRISIEINKIKAKLIKKAKRKGLYENFGQKELREVEDRYEDTRCTDYRAYKLIAEFGKWCMNFDDHDLRGD